MTRISFRPMLVACVGLILLLTACEMATPTPGSARGFAYIWYVATTGSDTNTCDAPEQPCATLQGALDKASTTNTRIEAEYTEPVSLFHTINVAAGTYNVTALHDGYPFARVVVNATIVGAGQATTIFEAADQYGGIFINGDLNVTLRNFTIQNVDGHAPDSCVNIRGAAEVTIEDLTIRHCVKSGIAHISSGPLTLINVTSTENIVDAGGNGTGVSSSGDLTIEGGSFSSNEGTGIASSGALEMSGALIELNDRDGISLRGSANISDVRVLRNGQDLTFRAGLFMTTGASATVANSRFENNQYGIWLRGAGANLRLNDSIVTGNPRTGIVVSEGELRLTRSTVEGNASFYAATSLGGGIDIGTAARAILRESQVNGNFNGGINNYGELFLIESSLVGNDGGLPALLNNSGATAVVERSLVAGTTFSERAVTGEQAVDNRGSMNFINSTVSGNEGTGFSNSGAFNLVYSTIAQNASFGLLSSESSSAAPWLTGNIIAGNGTDCYLPGASGPGPATLIGHNIDGDDSCDFPEAVNLADLNLDSLADNGGPTLTHALLTGSPAIDASTVSCPPNDQRVRARPFGAACDVGAYEAGSTIVRISDESVEFEPEIVTVTPTPGPITAIITSDARCRTGPGFVYGDYDFFTPNQSTVVYGRSQDSSWFQVQALSFSGKCWIGKAVLQFDVNTDALLALPVLQAPATPTPTLDPDEGSDGGQSGGGQSGGGSGPAAPSGLQANEATCNANKYEIMLTWKDNAGNEDGFRIYHNGQQVASVGADVTKFAFSVPGGWGQQQSFFVEAFNNAGTSKSNTATEDGCIY